MPDIPSVLVLISGDPRSSPRAFEAMRIGVGVVAGETPLRLVLTGPAVHLLDADTDDLVDGDDIAKFRDTLRRLGVPLHVAADAIPDDPDWNADGLDVVAVSPAQIADLVRRSRRALIF